MPRVKGTFTLRIVDFATSKCLKSIINLMIYTVDSHGFTTARE